jgi:hypothetical protein
MEFSFWWPWSWNTGLELAGQALSHFGHAFKPIDCGVLNGRNLINVDLNFLSVLSFLSTVFISLVVQFFSVVALFFCPYHTGHVVIVGMCLSAFKRVYLKHGHSVISECFH